MNRTWVAAPANISLESALCLELKVVDASPHHPCYNWNVSRVECAIEWPCGVREFLVTLWPLISLSRGLLSWGTLVIILLGLLLNLVSVYTLWSSGLARSASGVYLVSLAAADCGNLLANYAVGIGRATFPQFNTLFMESEWLCRWHAVFVEIFQLISAWIVVGFTLERCLAVWYPMMLRHTSRTGRAKRVVGSLATLLTAFSLSKLLLTGFEKDSVFGYPACYSGRYRWHGMAYLRVAFQTWIPTLLVFTFNLFMFCKLKVIKRQRHTLTQMARPKAPAHRQGSLLSRPSATAPMLVAVSLAYLVLVFPLGVVQTVELFWTVHYRQPVDGGMDNAVARLRFIQWKNTKLLLKYVRSLCFAFYQINFCINFFLYFAAGLQFRVHLQTKIKVLCRRWTWCSAPQQPLGHNNPNTPNHSRNPPTSSTTVSPPLFRTIETRNQGTPTRATSKSQIISGEGGKRPDGSSGSPYNLLQVEEGGILNLEEEQARRFELEMMCVEEGDPDHHHDKLKEVMLEEELGVDDGIALQVLHLPAPLVPTPSPVRSNRFLAEQMEEL